MTLRNVLLAAAIGMGAAVTSAQANYIQTNLVSDIPGLAIITDPALKNPWGISHSAGSPFWISDQGTNLSTLYAVNSAGIVSKNALEVAIPTTATGPQGPTGQVQNNTTGFPVNTTPASFIFANLNGTISAWNGSAGTTAQVKATTSGAVYTGLAIASPAAGPRLYAADTAGNKIDVFDANFVPVPAASLPLNAFKDPQLPAGLVVFNVQNIGGNIYVTYAPAGLAAMRAATPGQGVVAVFDANGVFVTQLINGSELAAPWGLALAPAGFADFAGDLLVGNFSFVQSEINAFDPVTGAFRGVIPINAGAGNTPGGLWGLSFGIGGNNGDPNTLYIADGINGEADGLFAAISVPEPGTLALFLTGVMGAFGVRKRRQKVHAL